MPETLASLELISPDAETTRNLGEALGRHLQAGDVVLLDGNLGAGKTTFVQGVSRALDVKGRVTSPTFIVARTHRARAAGPSLVHVDAYRLEDALDLETIDLEDSLPESITFIEWGRGKVEGLAPERLEIELLRPAELVAEDPEREVRRLRFIPYGANWRRRLAEFAPELEALGVP